ncbi:MAG: type II secretion system protein GspN [Nitrospiria bacterium]
MKIQKDKLIRLSLYTLFGFSTFLFFMLMTFPFDLIEEQLLRQLEATSGCRVTVKESRHGFPVRVSWRGVQSTCPKRVLGLRGTGMIDLHVQSIDAALSLTTALLKQEGRIRFTIATLLGPVPGVLTLREKNEQLQVSLKIEKAQLTIEEAGLSGTLSLEGQGEWTNQDVLKGTGKVALNIEKARFKEFAGVVLPIGEVSFTTINGRVFWREGRAVIEKFSAKGEMADLESESGTILLRTPPDNSLLTLSLRAMPKGSLKEMAGLFIQGYNGQEPLKIRVGGSARAPQLSINGKAVSLGF